MKIQQCPTQIQSHGQELLAAVEACKHFSQIIRGCEIQIHTDHQNLMNDNTQHANIREMRARIFLDSEFAPSFIHIKGTDNTVADGLSRLLMMDDSDNPPELAPEIFAILQNNLNRDDNNKFPLNMKWILADQKMDNNINRIIGIGKHSDKISTKTIDGCKVLTFNNLVWVPKNLQQGIVKWYDSNLQHARINQSIGQMFTWKGLSTMVEKHISTCDRHMEKSRLPLHYATNSRGR